MLVQGKIADLITSVKDNSFVRTVIEIDAVTVTISI